MLIIAIGHSSNWVAPYSCSCTATERDCDHNAVDSVLACIMRKQGLPFTYVDELIVIENENIIAQYKHTYPTCTYVRTK